MVGRRAQRAAQRDPGLRSDTHRAVGLGGPRDVERAADLGEAPSHARQAEALDEGHDLGSIDRRRSHGGCGITRRGCLGGVRLDDRASDVLHRQEQVLVPHTLHVHGLAARAVLEGVGEHLLQHGR